MRAVGVDRTDLRRQPAARPPSLESGLTRRSLDALCSLTPADLLSVCRLTAVIVLLPLEASNRLTGSRLGRVLAVLTTVMHRKMRKEGVTAADDLHTESLGQGQMSALEPSLAPHISLQSDPAKAMCIFRLCNGLRWRSQCLIPKQIWHQFT